MVWKEATHLVSAHLLEGSPSVEHPVDGQVASSIDALWPLGFGVCRVGRATYQASSAPDRRAVDPHQGRPVDDRC